MGLSGRDGIKGKYDSFSLYIAACHMAHVRFVVYVYYTLLVVIIIYILFVKLRKC